MEMDTKPLSLFAAATALFCLIFAVSTTVEARKANLYANLTITTFDGYKLHANAYVPIQEQPGQQFAVVFFPNSWDMPSFEYIVKVSDFAEKFGFIALEYETRGWYLSGGTIDTAGPLDRRDISTVIDFILNQTHWNVNSSAIGMCGISYGGGLSLMGAGYDSRVKAVAALSGWGNLVTSLYPDGSPAGSTVQLLVDTARLLGHPSAELIQISKDFFEHKNVSGIIAFGEQRSPLKFIDQINQRKVPVFMSNNLWDTFFPGNQNLDFFEKLQGPKRMLFNQGGHAEAEAFGLFDLKNYVWTRAQAFLQFWLQGVPTGIMDEPEIQFEAGNTIFSGDYVPFKTWPDRNAVMNVPFKITARGGGKFGGLVSNNGASVSFAHKQHQRNKALFQAEKTEAVLASIRNKHHSNNNKANNKNRNLRGDTDSISFSMLPGPTAGGIIVDYLFPLGIPVPLILDVELLLLPSDTSIIYRTAPFAHDTLICGTASLNITVYPNQPQWQIYAYLYDSDALDIARLVTWAAYTDFTGNNDNQTTNIRNWKLRTLCHRFPAGHRAALAFALYNEQFLPAVNSSSLSVGFGSYSDAVLTLPINPN